MPRRLQAWLWLTLIAPFVPWFTLPIPMALFIALDLVSLPAILRLGSPPDAAALATGILVPIVGALWIATAFVAFFAVRRRAWGRAVWPALSNLGAGGTLLVTVLLVTGLGPVEPYGYVSPLAFLTLAALPAAYEIAHRWLRDLGERRGLETQRQARFQLLVLGSGYAAAFALAAFALAARAAAEIDTLGIPRFDSDVQIIREAAAATFFMVGAVSLAAFLGLGYLAVTPRALGT